MTIKKSPERLVFFGDAVVAIALTALVLPLTELVPEIASKDVSPSHVISENSWQITSFLLSFAVIARLWMAHHRVFEQVRSYSTPLMVAHLCWLLTIVVLPFPSEMVGAFGEDRFTELFYIGTILASVICQLVMVLILHAHPALTSVPSALAQRQRFVSAGNVLVLAMAFVLVAVLPSTGYYTLLLLALVPVATRLRYGSRSMSEEPAVTETESAQSSR